jgi:4-hydroxybenzoate polyprenyltransferase
MMALSLFLVRSMIIVPFLESDNLLPSLSLFHFTLIVAAVLLIAAGGNIINDINDVDTDTINKEKKIPVKYLNTRILKLIYFLITIAGVIIGSAITILNGLVSGAAVLIFCAGLLYYYSTTFKHNTLTGNIIVSFLTGFVIYLPVMFDTNAENSLYVLTIVPVYAVFAFLISMAREIVKDCEDIKGDSDQGYKTLPIVVGVSYSRRIAGTFSLLVFTAIGVIQVYQQQWLSLTPFIYVVAFIQLPLMYVTFKLMIKKSQANDNKNDSRLLKLIMATGLLSMVIFNYFS